MSKDFAPKINPHWQTAMKIMHGDDDGFDLETFKSSRTNFKICLWNPQTNGVRYLKSLIYCLASQLPEAELAGLDKIGGRSLGRPITVRYRGREICLDYLQALLEAGFIERGGFDFDSARVLEIGGGYGRTCHTLLCRHEEIAKYHILDLAEMFRVSNPYLSSVLPRRLLNKVVFTPIEAYSALKLEMFDLALNIDGFNEMDETVVAGYLDYIDRHADWFYTKNPVAKYLDPELDGHWAGKQAVEEALSAGILRDVIDVFDSEQVEQKIAGFLKAHLPGPSWTRVRHAVAAPWSYYHQALYRKKGGG